MVERIRLRSSPHGGDRRKKEVPNKGTTNLVKAVVLAATQVGGDGLGKQALVGYFQRFARAEPKLFFALLVRAIPYQKICEEKIPRTRDELYEWLSGFGFYMKYLREENLDKILKSLQSSSARVNVRVTTDLVEAIILAATQVGEDGLGKEGLVGYFRRFARAEPNLFFALVANVIPYQSICEDKPEVEPQTREELEKELHEMGFPKHLFHGDDEEEFKRPGPQGM